MLSKTHSTVCARIVMEEQDADDAVALQQAYDGHMNQPHVRMFQSTTDKRIDKNRQYRQ